MANIYAKRFQEIADELEAVAKTRTKGQNAFGSFDYVDSEQGKKWIVRAESLIANACGLNSEHLKHFVEGQRARSAESGWSRFLRLKAVFEAAKADFDGGYLISMRSLIQAEVFGNELEQAQELLDKGYKAPAAVIAGVVLETALRELCDRGSIAHGKLDKMNADLAKAGTYNLLQQKRITAIAQIRNDAAHGNWTQFTDADVKAMIADVERFLATHLS